MTKLTMFRPCKMLMILILFITCGCATRYTPQPYPMTSEAVPEFDVKQAITIVNAQKSKTFKVPVGPDETMKGNLKKWTGTAVEVLKTELKKHDMTISEDAPKVLKLAITKVHIFSGMRQWNTRCVVYLQAETGDGYIKEYEGSSFSLEGYREASPLAVTKAVAAMLHDDIILSYLKSSASLFSMGDLKDSASLVVKLRDASDPLSLFLWEQLSPETQQILSKYDDSSPPSESLQNILIQEFNQLLQGPSLYDADHFTHVTLSQETQELIEQSPEGKDLIHLNRLLLEEAYPHEIAKSLKK